MHTDPQASSPGINSGDLQSEHSLPPPKPKGGRRLDAAMKERVCQFVAAGHSIEVAADMVGVSERTIYRERKRDALFGLQLSKDKEEIAGLCLATLKAAAAENWRAAMQLWKMVYPHRWPTRADTISVKQFEKWNGELLRILSTIMTDQQMQQFNQFINSPKLMQLQGAA